MTRTMKDSGVEWIGQIPNLWSSIRIKNIIAQRDAGAWGELEQGNNNDVICIRVADFDYSHFTIQNNKDYTLRNYSDFQIKSLKLNKGDILIEKSGGGEKTPVGRTVIFDKNFKALFANFIERIRVTEEIYYKYFQYIFSSFYSQGHTKLYIKQTTGIQNLNITEMFSREVIPLPPLSEQQAIANYLDDKCAQIDNITATINEQIEVLKQYKKSVITEAVTKGLDPNVPMKDSGVEWIEQIPEKWNIERFKYNFTFSKGLQITKADLREEGCPVISYGQIHSKINNGVSVNLKLIRFVDGSYQEEKSAITQYGDIIWADTSEDYDGIGNSIFIDSNKNIFAGYHTIITRPLLDKITKYFAYLFQTDIWRLQLRKQATGIKVFSITQKMLKNCSILIPPLCEQQAIADYLDDKCAQIDAIIANKQAQLETLAAYKKSLIYEYVTGKKSVPGFEEA